MGFLNILYEPEVKCPSSHYKNQYPGFCVVEPPERSSSTCGIGNNSLVPFLKAAAFPFENDFTAYLFMVSTYVFYLCRLYKR